MRGGINKSATRRRNLLIIDFADDERPSPRWQSRIKEPPISQFLKIDILHSWQCRCVAPEDNNLASVQLSSVSGMFFQCDSAVAFKDDEFAPGLGSMIMRFSHGNTAGYGSRGRSSTDLG